MYEYWHEYKTEKKPRFVKTQNRKRNNEVVYELALIFPNNRWATKTFVKDSLGRLVEAKYEDDKFRIKEIIPYWKEELIYDFQKKERIRYHELLEQIISINEIGQIFTLNNKLFVQNDDNILLFGNKNIRDAKRLFELVPVQSQKDHMLNIARLSAQQEYDRIMELVNVLRKQADRDTRACICWGHRSASWNTGDRWTICRGREATARREPDWLDRNT